MFVTRCLRFIPIETKMEQHMITQRKLVTGALHRKQQESSSKTETVSSLVPSTQSNYGNVGSGNSLCRNQPEIYQRIHSMQGKCPITNGSSNIRLDGKMPPLYPNMLLGKLTEIENHYIRETDQVWKSPMTYFSLQH